MNRTVKEATITAFHYPDLESLKAHVLAFVPAYNFAKHLKALRWKTPFEAICHAWTTTPDIFKTNPRHLIPGPNNYCVRANVEFTRCRPYRKNDQAGAEQKNGAVVRHTVGYRRFAGLEAAAALTRLYRSRRLFVNFFQPSFKLAEKSRDGAEVRKRYYAPATPYQRLIADLRTSDAVRARLGLEYARLDPVQRLNEVRDAQTHLVEIADRPVLGDPAPPTAPTLEQFLCKLRTAWQDGEIRPTRRTRKGAKRGRRRPNPFVAVTVQMRE